MLTRFLAVALGGAVGCMLRYGTTLGAARFFGTGFPFGTLIANLAGCLLAGLIFGVTAKHAGFSPLLRVLLLTGFLGGYTTFSSFMAETVTLMQDGSWALAAGNFLANNVAGGVLAIGGIYLGRLV